MGSDQTVAIVVGAVIVIVGFSLWPVLNGASNNLSSLSQASCVQDASSRYRHAYNAIATGVPSALQYNTTTGEAGGAGVPVSQTSSATTCSYGAGLTAGSTFVVNEYGDVIASAAKATHTPIRGSSWAIPERILQLSAGINGLLLAFLPMVGVLGFLGISITNLASYFLGSSSLATSIRKSIVTLCAVIGLMVILPLFIVSIVGANQVVNPYPINQSFGNVLDLLVVVLPVTSIAGTLSILASQVYYLFSQDARK